MVKAVCWTGGRVDCWGGGGFRGWIPKLMNDAESDRETTMR